MDFKWYVSGWVLITGTFERIEETEEHPSGPALPHAAESQAGTPWRLSRAADLPGLQGLRGASRPKGALPPLPRSVGSTRISLVGEVAALPGKADCVPVSFSPWHDTRHGELRSAPRLSL